MADRSASFEAARTQPSPTRWTPSLLVAALATFDAVLFVLLLVLAGHVAGILSDILAGLNTVIGAVIFVYLWALVVLGVEWVLRPVSLTGSPAGTLALRAVVGGALVGAAFLVGIVLVATAPLVLTGNLTLVSLGLVALIGAAVAIVVGGVTGLLFGLLDLGLYRLAGRLLPARATDPDRL